MRCTISVLILSLLARAPFAHAQAPGPESIAALVADGAKSEAEPDDPTSLSRATLSAQSSAEGRKPPSVYDRIWKFANLYENDSNRVMQKVVFTGRYQHDYAALDADQGRLDEWNVRRVRLGSKWTLFRTLTLHGEVELNPQEADPLYKRVTDMYVQWSPSGRLAVTVGKHGVPFTMDGATSSKELLAIDRSSLSNNMWFPQEYIPGVTVSGEIAPWVYRAGVFSAGASNREFGEFDGGAFTLGVLGYDFAERLGVKQALLSGNYVFQQHDPRNTFTRQLGHVVSANFGFEAVRWGARTDFSAASGYLGQGDLIGVVAMPFVNLTRKFQLVGRYTFLDGDGPNTVRLTTYESRLATGLGDRYNELYVGVNYFFYGHKLKLQSGLQIADMQDSADDGGAYSGVSWNSGLRLSW